MRARSSASSAPGRHSSRRLQLEQFAACLRAAGMRFSMGWMAMTAAATCMCDLLLARGALRNQVAQSVEVGALVEEAARAEAFGVPAVRLGGEVGQHVERDAGLEAVHGAQHVEAAALLELHVEQHDVGPGGEDRGDRLVGVACLADELRPGNALEQAHQALSDG